MPELTLDQVEELRTACLDNSIRLIQDAELMLANRRWPAAYESAYFALEEVAKSSDLYAVAHLLAAGKEVNWEAFWKRWKAHPAKSLGFVMLGNLHHEVIGLGHATDEDLEYDPAAEAAEAKDL